MERSTVPDGLLPLTPGGAPMALGEEKALDQSKELDSFLAGVEKRAFRIAQIAMRDTEAALDIVQEAMLQLVRRYSDKPPAEWPPLFYRILQNRIRDWQRKNTVRSRVMAWWAGGVRREDEPDLIEDAPDPRNVDPGHEAMMDEAMDALAAGVRALPARQQEAFMLRTFEGLDVAATAKAMRCSQGSVKTHYSRAVHTLREKLGAHWGAEE